MSVFPCSFSLHASPWYNKRFLIFLSSFCIPSLWWKFLLFLKVFWWHFWVFMYNISSLTRDALTSYFPICSSLISFSCLIAPANVSSYIETEIPSFSGIVLRFSLRWCCLWVNILRETPLERSNYEPGRGCQLEITSLWGMGPFCLLSNEAPSGLSLCRSRTCWPRL